MPEISYSAMVRAPAEGVWAFCKDFQNWAHFMWGYQSHEVINDRESIWHIKGEVGGVTRTAKLRALITEWDEPQHLTFILKGLTEPIHGSGSVDMRPYMPGEELPELPQKSWLSGFFEWLGHIYRRLRRLPPNGRRLVSPATIAGGPSALVTVSLAMYWKGTMGPVMDALFQPLLSHMAEELAVKLAAAVEEAQATLSNCSTDD